MKNSSLQKIEIEAMNLLHRRKHAYMITILGKRFKVCPGVYTPRFFNVMNCPTSLFLIKHQMVNTGDHVLDLGTGTGVQGIFAAQKASFVVATDINPASIECARENARLNNITNIEFREGDLFKPVRGERFDLILCAPPTAFGKPKDSVETAWFSGPNGEWMLQFCEEAPAYLKDKGKIQFVCTVNSGFMIYHLQKNGLTVLLYKQKKRFFLDPINIYVAYKHGTDADL